MNFFRDENGAKEVLQNWMSDSCMYCWNIREAQKMAFKIFAL